MYDAVIVGARCAGAATGMLLARQGHRVLMIDQATFPSDVRLSTHLIWHAGVDILHKWGVLEALRRSSCPPLTDFSLDLGEMVLRGRPPGTQVGAAFAPRRVVLDQILLDAAVAAGAEFRAGVSFEEPVLDDKGRVGGVKVRTAEGHSLTLPTRLLIGADGRYSKVARAVGSTAYDEFPKESGSYNTFSYFSGVSLEGVEFVSRPQRMAYAWRTNDGLVLAGLMQPASDDRAMRQDVEGHFFAELSAMSPDLAARVRAGQREDDWVSAAIPTFCRQAAGPGWALVGDAGMTVDPITAAGITHALRDADLLAELVDSGLSGDRPLDEALATFEPRRNAVSQPLHHFAQQMAALAPPTPDVLALFGALAGKQAQIDRYFGLFGQTVSPADFFSADNMAQIMAPRPAMAA